MGRTYQKGAPIPSYNVRDLSGRADREDYAFLALPDSADRVYDSSLSKPGRICRRCRSFVAGGQLECPNCRATD